MNRWMAVAVAALMVRLLAACGPSNLVSPRAAPDVVEKVGALELVTHERVTAGPDTVRSGWVRHNDWSLRSQGRPLQIQALAGMFADKTVTTERLHAVFLLEQVARPPELLVLAGDANNTGSYHLVTQPTVADAGPGQGPNRSGLQPLVLCAVTGGDNSLGRVQTGVDGVAQAAAQGAPEPTWLRGPQRVNLPAASGQRYLLLGSRCLLDTATRSVRIVPERLPGWSYLNQHPLALMSPDGGQLVLAVRRDNAPEQLALAVLVPGAPPAGVVPGTVPAIHWEEQQPPAWQTLPIDRSRQRIPRAEVIGAGWVQHHFEWQAAGGAMSLQPRRHYTPLPHRGWFLEGGDEYRVEGLSPVALQALALAAALRLGTSMASPAPQAHATDPRSQLRVDGIDVTVSGSSLYVSLPLNLPAGHPAADAGKRRAALQRVVGAVDAELATGNHDAGFDFTQASR